jgi:hypothetical protein
MSRYLRLSCWYHSRHSPKTGTDPTTAKPAGTTPEGFARVLVAAAGKQFLMSCRPKKISCATSAGNQRKAAANEAFFKGQKSPPGLGSMQDATATLFHVWEFNRSCVHKTNAFRQGGASGSSSLIADVRWSTQFLAQKWSTDGRSPWAVTTIIVTRLMVRFAPTGQQF